MKSVFSIATIIKHAIFTSWMLYLGTYLCWNNITGYNNKQYGEIYLK